MLDDKRALAIELLRTGVSSDAYALMFTVLELEFHEDITSKIVTEDGMYRLSDEDADSLS